MTSPLPKRTLSFLLYIALAMAFALMLLNRYPPAIEVGGMAPIDEGIIMIDGTKKRFREFLDRPLVVNFWGSFCPSCLEEMPILKKAYQKYKDKVSFLGAAIDTTISEVVDLSNRFKINFFMGVINDKTLDAFRADALPTTYMLNPQGKVLWAKVGKVSLAELEDAINLILVKKREKP